MLSDEPKPLDQAYQSYTYRLPELAHGYGPRVHLLADPVLLTQLARLCRADVIQPEITRLVRDIYHGMARMVIASEFPRCQAQVKTRMYESTERGVWAGELLDPNVRAVTVGIARAGTLPSQVVFETLVELVQPEHVRQDHVYMSRTTDADGKVTGVNMAGNKIGGDVADAIVLLPDPMGATGGSLSRTLELYKASDPDRPAKRYISLHLIITPELVRRMQSEHPDLSIYAVRMDRGTSPAALFETPLGAQLQQESGLNEIQYIVPGAGGVGEILNNSFV
jgi:uracil phosphoribosyltransferase